ncbi:unnamed protein product [Prunus armeniaca]
MASMASLDIFSEGERFDPKKLQEKMRMLAKIGFHEGLLSSEQGAYIAESIAAKNMKQAKSRFRMYEDATDHGGSNHSAKVEPSNGCTGERETGKSAKKLVALQSF